MKGQKQLLSSNSDEWGTPQELFDYLDKKYKFELDPCATSKNKKCGFYYSKKEDGLLRIWNNYKSAFCNPPYSELKKWVKKAYEESIKGMLVVMLITARVDTAAWHDYIFPYAKEIWFIRGRLKFNKHKNPSFFPSAIVIFKKSLFNKQKIKSINKEQWKT